MAASSLSKAVFHSLLGFFEALSFSASSNRLLSRKRPIAKSHLLGSLDCLLASTHVEIPATSVIGVVDFNVSLSKSDLTSGNQSRTSCGKLQAAIGKPVIDSVLPTNVAHPVGN